MGDQKRYEVGDVANGYILGRDRQWHPLSPPTAPQAVHVASTPSKTGGAAIVFDVLGWLTLIGGGLLVLLFAGSGLWGTFESGSQGSSAIGFFLAGVVGFFTAVTWAVFRLLANTARKTEA